MLQIIIVKWIGAVALIWLQEFHIRIPYAGRFFADTFAFKNMGLISFSQYSLIK